MDIQKALQELKPVSVTLPGRQSFLSDEEWEAILDRLKTKGIYATHIFDVLQQEFDKIDRPFFKQYSSFAISLKKKKDELGFRKKALKNVEIEKVGAYNPEDPNDAEFG